MDKAFTVLGAHQRRVGGVVITDHDYDEWTCPECHVISYVPVVSHFDSLSCCNPDHGEAPVWMTKTASPLTPDLVRSRLSATPASPKEKSASPRRSRSGRAYTS